MIDKKKYQKTEVSVFKNGKRFIKNGSPVVVKNSLIRVIQESFKGIEYQGKIFPLLKKIGPQESDMIDISGIFFSEPDCTGYLKNTRKHYIEKSKQINGSKSRASNYFSTPRLKSLRSKPENIQHNQTRLSAKQLALLRKRLGLGPLKKN